MSITISIIAVTILTSILAFNNQKIKSDFIFNPAITINQKQWHRFITHALIHGDFFHLFVNMYVLYNFGPIVEESILNSFPKAGKTVFLFLYLSGILFSCIPSIRKHRNNYQYNALGASGAVSSILFSSIIFYPTSEIYILFIPFGIPAFLFGFLYLLYEASMNKRGQTNIAHDAHFYGAIWGVLFLSLLNYKYLISFVIQVKMYLSGIF